ncbi:MAG TPA: hypothetical protein DHV64_13925 [Erythrobacter sp.]|nr:hypothetical protein [Erythrobacter sp.]
MPLDRGEGRSTGPAAEQDRGGGANAAQVVRVRCGWHPGNGALPGLFDALSIGGKRRPAGPRTRPPEEITDNTHLRG